jgi:uncharacterized membrane protein
MQPDRYKSFGEAAKETVSKHGFAGLYKGVGSPLVGNGLYNAVQFAVFANLKKAFTNDGRDVTLNRIAGAGAITGLFVALVEAVSTMCNAAIQLHQIISSQSIVCSPKICLSPRYRLR